MLHARWVDFEPAAFGRSVSYRNAVQTIFVSSPALMLALPVALIAYLGWKRTRYFGNTAPLLIAVLLLILALALPIFPGKDSIWPRSCSSSSSSAGCLPICWRLRQGLLVTAGLCGLLGASAIWNLLQLWRA